MADAAWRRRLVERYAAVAERCAACRDAYPHWPCRQGCDACCRSLAGVPEVTRVEWEVMVEGLLLLPARARQEIDRRIEALADGAAPQRGAVVCPFLDETGHACHIYGHRPAACRMHGFYVSRGEGLWCQEIEALSASGALDHVVLGNHEAVVRRLAAELGESRPIRAWRDGGR